MAGCTGLLATPPAPGATLRTTANAAASAASSAPQVSVPGASAPLPPGATTIDTAFDFGVVAWSPDGTTVAAEALGQTAGTGTVDLFTPAGVRLASVPGYAFGWLDATRLLVFTPTPTDVSTGTVSVWSSDGHLVERLAGQFGGVLANGHGAAVLRMAPPQAAYGGNDFAFWSGGTPGPMIAGPGIPQTWSPDGRLLAVPQSTLTVQSLGGIVLASSGGPILGYLHVLRYPGGTEVGSFRDHPIDLQGGVAFSPDSRYLAAGGFAAAGVLVFDLVTGRVASVPMAVSAWRWAPDGRLAITGPDGMTRLWSTDGTLAPSGLPPGDPIYGPRLSEVAILPLAQGPGLAVTLQTARGSVTVPVAVSGMPVAWAPDGLSCLLSTGGTGYPGGARLVRVALP